jgi:phosphatidylglycerol:prolipoprotein diacylglycerol transferase
VLAALTLTFDPVLRIGDTVSVRWETIGLAIVLFVGLLLAARIGSGTPAGTGPSGPHLRVDDFVFIMVGAVPGAVVGGRLGYVLDHLEYYKANPTAILDATQGGYTLTLAVPLGILTGAVIARLLSASVGRWMHVIAPALLFVLAAGKLVGVLGATGQGGLSDLGWATAYGGPGPWATFAADLPSHPAQVYEAILVAVAIVSLFLLSRTPRFRRRDGAALYAALGLWAVARFLVAFTWRDPIVAGPLRMEQVLLLGVAIIAAIGLVHRPAAVAPAGEPGPTAAPEDEAEESAQVEDPTGVEPEPA